MYVWPENWQAYRVFCSMGTQWRMAGGMGGAAPTGLDYLALSAVMDFLDVPAADRGGMFFDVQVLESAALDAMADARAKQ